MINTVKFSDPISQGPLHEIIGWIDFGPNFILRNGYPQNITNILPDGYKINFTLLFSSPDENLSLIALPAPIANMNQIPFGNTSYSKINGNVVLYYSMNFTGTSNLLISNICINKINSCADCLCPNFSLIAADAETTSSNEIWQATSNGTPWIFIKNMTSSTGLSSRGPVFSGIGTQTVTETGTSNALESITAGAFLTINPSALSFSFTTNSSKSALALGVIINHTPTYNNICRSK